MMQALANDLKDSKRQRQTMVDCQIRTYEVTDQRVIDRFLDVPRERFVPDAVRALAYSDIGFTLDAEDVAGEARYLLAPLVLARLIQGGRVTATDRVLDVACGTGYSTAILAGLAGEVIGLEDCEARRRTLQANLSDNGFNRVRTLSGVLAEGSSLDAPFDVILVNGALATRPDMLLSQLADGGRLLAIRRASDDPTGRAAKAICYEKRGGEVGTRYLFDASAPVLRPFAVAPHFVF
jgi:protein-L-isoaspartate(D-aspartate) O-methyltransferase